MIELMPIAKLNKDLKEAAATLSQREARYLVDAYYALQEYRKAAGNQVGALTKSGEPHAVLRWFFDNAETLENQIKRALEAYAKASPTGVWSMSHIGIGPVIAAGLLAHIELEHWRCEVARLNLKEKPCTELAPHVGTQNCRRVIVETAGQIWRFAGLDITSTWKKGQKRPWNSQLKTLCWKMGQSFLKTMNHPETFYGRLLKERWEYEKARNSKGELAVQAAEKLAKFNIGKSTEAYGHYAAGHLPPAHILQRSCRWTVKLFLSHWHQVAYTIHFGHPPARPYVITHLGHVDVTPPPNWP